tara:strand:- start:311 stop:721 length:411 start_codon:yes stop_codon:yes gene_type:complete
VVFCRGVAAFSENIGNSSNNLYQKGKRSAAVYAEGVNRRGRQAERARGCPCIPVRRGKWKLAQKNDPEEGASGNLPKKRARGCLRIPVRRGKWKLAQKSEPGDARASPLEGASGNLPKKSAAEEGASGNLPKKVVG